jgi:NAD(P)H-hydrate epimerase
MARPFSAMLSPAARDVCGSLRVADIGLTGAALAADEEGPALLTAEALAPFACRRPHAAHKGAYGFLWAAAGSDAYPGAGILAAKGAARSGAGLLGVRAEGPRAFALTAAVPTAMPVAGNDPPARATAALVGPGLPPEEARAIAERALETPLALVLDAGALGDWTLHAVLHRESGETVLTPHEGELARMLGLDVEAVREDRAAAALAAAQEAKAVVVAKGAGTVVATPAGEVFLNRTGNPGMANGGSGDVLAGFLAGLLARAPMGGAEAACAAVYAHGVAGDLAAAAAGENAANASDLAAALRL